MQLGTPLPSFQLIDQEGVLFNSKSLLGQPSVLFFYPKNFTPICTKEVCGFRDSYHLFKDLNASIIGISTDNTESHKEFSKKHQLPFPLLSDPNKETQRLFCIKGPLFGLLPARETFIFDADGLLIAHHKGIAALSHIQKAYKTLKQTL